MIPRLVSWVFPWRADLEELPEGVSLELTIKKELPDQDRTVVELLARQAGKIVANEAGTVTVRTTNLSSGDVGDVDITIKGSFQWILEFGFANVRIAHIDSEGRVEILVPVCTGPDLNLDFTCTATSERGLSEFSLLALVDRPPAFTAKKLVVTPESMTPGETAKITVDIANEGVRAGSFSAILTVKSPGATDFEAIDVKEVTLLGGESGTVTFFVLREEQGTYDVDVEGLPGTFGVFKPIDPAQLTFSDLQISPSTVDCERTIRGVVCPPVSISTVVQNAGDADGRIVIEFRINEVISEILSLSVPGQGSVPLEFEFVPPAEGTFALTVIDPEEKITVPARGEFTASVALEPAAFSFANLDVSPLEVDPGDEVTLTFRITNFGELPGVRTVSLLLDGAEIASQDVQVIELSTKQVVFTITAPEEPGLYTTRIENLTSDFRVLEVAPVPLPRVQRLVVTPEPVFAGETVTVDVVVESVADEESSRTLTLRVDGEIVVPARLVTLDPREVKTESFTFAAPDLAGTHELEIDGIRRDFQVAAVIVAARLNLVALTVSPEVSRPGQLVTISVVLANAGGEVGTTEVILRVQGREVERKTVEVPGGETALPVTFEIRRVEEGNFAVEVEVLRAVDVKELEGRFAVLAPAIAKLIFVPGTLILDVDRVSIGEPVTVSIIVSNEGRAVGSRTVVLNVDGKEIDTQTVALEAGRTKLVEFTRRVVEREPGTHEVSVDGFSIQFTVERPAPLAITISLLVIFALLVAALAVLMYTRATRGSPPPQATLE